MVASPIGLTLAHRHRTTIPERTHPLEPNEQWGNVVSPRLETSSASPFVYRSSPWYKNRIMHIITIIHRCALHSLLFWLIGDPWGLKQRVSSPWTSQSGLVVEPLGRIGNKGIFALYLVWITVALATLAIQPVRHTPPIVIHRKWAFSFDRNDLGRPVTVAVHRAELSRLKITTTSIHRLFL